MYVVTFYSFKGGVGRSMALVNVGYQLAKAGRTVLLVDFDLEAPGLPTFNLQQPMKFPSGVVDYVHEYLATGEAPNVADYVYKSESFENGGGLWVMPAGKTDEYSPRFQKINWQDLYQNHDGFLLFEDLKEQWRTTIQPDYVLVDSRTGHTDIAGICTRQLPDAVCVLFFPNDQNLNGLKKIVDDIRAESRQGAIKRIGREVALHFVVSNVPTLDDEDRIVATRLRSFSQQLKYKTLSAQIHHYDSLALVNQLVFSKERPNSYLAKEYATLTEAIRRNNFEDRDTVLEALRRMVRVSRGPAKMPGDETVLPDERLRGIALTFPQDGEISFWLAQAWRFSGDAEAALLLFNKAIQNGYTSRDIFYERGILRRSRLEMPGAIEDFWSVLRSTDIPVSGRETFLSAQILLDLHPESVEEIASSWSVSNLPLDECQQFAVRMNDSEAGLKLTKLVLSRVIREAAPGTKGLDFFEHALGLALVGLGDFSEALGYFAPREPESAEFEQAREFNLAMAEWGETGQVNRLRFESVVKADKEPKKSGLGQNYFQCLAIANWAVGDQAAAARNLGEAKRLTQTTNSRDFSAWRYLKVDPAEFLRDLEEIAQLISDGKVLPRFMSRTRHAVR